MVRYSVPISQSSLSVARVSSQSSARMLGIPASKIRLCIAVIYGVPAAIKYRVSVLVCLSRSARSYASIVSSSLPYFVCLVVSVPIMYTPRGYSTPSLM